MNRHRYLFFIVLFKGSIGKDHVHVSITATTCVFTWINKFLVWKPGRIGCLKHYGSVAGSRRICLPFRSTRGTCTRTWDGRSSKQPGYRGRPGCGTRPRWICERRCWRCPDRRWRSTDWAYGTTRLGSRILRNQPFREQHCTVLGSFEGENLMEIQWHANLIKRKHFELRREKLLNVRWWTREMMISGNRRELISLIARFSKRFKKENKTMTFLCKTQKLTIESRNSIRYFNYTRKIGNKFTSFQVIPVNSNGAGWWPTSTYMYRRFFESKFFLFEFHRRNRLLVWIFDNYEKWIYCYIIEFIFDRTFIQLKNKTILTSFENWTISKHVFMLLLKFHRLKVKKNQNTLYLLC